MNEKINRDNALYILSFILANIEHAGKLSKVELEEIETEAVEAWELSKRASILAWQ